ncbi:hypothetical protein FA15DRAFT_589623 [Coprinopsis marcescibilis]|uniref:Uncharacterized protein n=1 Tax=Coprinopsis marcescibilis TaxID=230819 RepID=A0A5C3KZR0_COPMA|nr:hypothetical protein FA15DRAFT_589623 [Coprinopsis marcescibilis]
MRFIATLFTVCISALAVRRTAAQRGCEGAVGALYDGSTTCDPATRAAVCTWMVPRECCRSFWHSGSMTHISGLPEGEAGWGLLPQSYTSCAGNASRNSRADPGCLSHDGAKTVFGVSWAWCHQDLSATPFCGKPITGAVDNVTQLNSDVGDSAGGCERPVSPDIFYLYEKEGEAAKPYSQMVTMTLDKAGAIDWSTRTVKLDKADVFQSVVAAYGDGLKGAQLNALEILAKDDARHGF